MSSSGHGSLFPKWGRVKMVLNWLYYWLYPLVGKYYCITIISVAALKIALLAL